MKKEFESLSNEIIIPEQEGGYLLTRKVKEAVKRLKEEMCRCGTMAKRCYLCRNLDKIFGDKLI